MKIHPIIYQMVARCHVGDSNRKVLYYCVAGLREGLKGFLAMDKAARRRFMEQAIAAHKQNRELYDYVMKGKPKSRRMKGL